MNKSQIGIIGLGPMGTNMALNFAKNNVQVSIYNPVVKGEKDLLNDFVNSHPNKLIKGFDNLETFWLSLSSPKIIILMIKAGSPIDSVITSLLPFINEGDIVIDGGNSFFKDYEKRNKILKNKNAYFFGVGISGGEEGMRKGASIMAGGNSKIYPIIEKYLKIIVAKDDNNQPCVEFVGNDGAGHFVKMVHNGIEYVEMQFLAELFDVFLNSRNHTHIEISNIFDDLSKDNLLGSYLLDITKDILQKKENNQYILDQISDKAEQKGTGGWCVASALELGVPLPMISTSVNQRLFASHKDKRVILAQFYKHTNTKYINNIDVKTIKNAYLFAKLSNFCNAFLLLNTASNYYNWNLNLNKILRIWSNGSIIRSNLITFLRTLNLKNNDALSLPEISEIFINKRPSLNSFLNFCVMFQVSCPAFYASFNYFETMTTEKMTTNLIQAQRDYFGNHGYQKVNSDPSLYFHTKWKDNE